MNDIVIDKFLSSIKNNKIQINKIYLFGSRVRDDFKPDSDYDILLVLSKKESKLIDKFYEIVVDIFLYTGKMISLKIFKEEEFKKLSNIPTPFMKRILTEGKILG